MSQIAPDGSPVLLYARLPALGEAELIHEAVPAESQILELGAGAGRITHELVAFGHNVVAIDNSAEMLAFIHGAEKVLADMETLDLERRFPVVVLWRRSVPATAVRDGRRADLRRDALRGRRAGALARVRIEVVDRRGA